MIDDILQSLINKKTYHFGCDNCEMGFCMNYSLGDRICSGVVTKPLPEKPYDVIRLCIIDSNETQPYDFTPDEANSIVTVLTHSIGDWLTNTKPYLKFRNIKNND